MNKHNYIACRRNVSAQHGRPPADFLDTLVDTLDNLPDEVFALNDKIDIYSVMHGALGPYTGIVHRKAVMCEVLRVVAAFESDWNWNEGIDIGKPEYKKIKEAEEAGAFQVSWDSMAADSSLKACVDRHAGSHDVDTFITAMKTNHRLAIEYCARLFRFDTRWCGTVNRTDMVMAHVNREAVKEFESFLTPA